MRRNKMPKVCLNSALEMKELQFPWMGWRYHEYKQKGEKYARTPPDRYWVKKFERGKMILVWSNKMAKKFLEELKKCREEVEVIKVVPGGLELYTKLANSNIKSGSESNISKNDVEEELLKVKVGKLEKKMADLEKEVNMQK